MQPAHRTILPLRVPVSRKFSSRGSGPACPFILRDNAGIQNSAMQKRITAGFWERPTSHYTRPELSTRRCARDAFREPNGAWFFSHLRALYVLFELENWGNALHTCVYNTRPRARLSRRCARRVFCKVSSASSAGCRVLYAHQATRDWPGNEKKKAEQSGHSGFYFDDGIRTIRDDRATIFCAACAASDWHFSTVERGRAINCWLQFMRLWIYTSACGVKD